MIKAISYWSLNNGLEGTGPIDDALQQAKRHGFQGVELAFAEKGVLTPDTDEAACTQYRKLADKHGIIVETVASGMSWGCSPTNNDPAIRQKSIDLHKAALERAAWLGAKSMLFIPGAITIPWDPAYGPIRFDNAVTWAQEAVNALLPIAHKHKVELCIENVWNGMFYTPYGLAAFVDSFQSEWIGIYFDVGNVMGFEQHPPHWIDLLGKRIKRIHLKDFKRALRNMSGFCDLMDGDVPWKEVMQSLKNISYDKTLVAEMIPSNDEVLARTSAALDKIMAL